MCKKGKKIIINLFGPIEDMKKKNCDIAVSRTNEEKKMSEKKNAGRLDRLLPFFFLDAGS